MAKRKITTGERHNRENEVLNSQVRLDGIGEDGPVADLARLPEMSNVDAAKVALQLQQLIRGENSILGQQQTELMNRLMEKMEAMDRMAAKWESDRLRYVEEMTAMADRLRKSEDAQEKARAQAGIDLARATQEARASMALDKRAYDEFLAKEPKVTVVSPGVIMTVTENGSPTAKLMPEEIRVKHRRFVLQPGIPIDLPKSIADVYNSRVRSRAETREREEVLKMNLESGKLEERMREIDAKYGSNGSLFSSEQAGM